MRTRSTDTRCRGLFAAAAVAAMLGAARAPASTLEEVVVIGAVWPAAAEQARFEAEMASYARRVQAALRDSMRQSLERSTTPSLRLADSTESHRG